MGGLFNIGRVNMATNIFKVFGDNTAATAAIGQIPQAIGCPVVEVDPASAQAFDPTTDMTVESLIDASSTPIAQNPTGLGVANALQVNFGAPQGSGATPVSLSALGVVTFNDAGTYLARIALQFGRTGASGTSVMLFRALLNGVQISDTVVAKLSNANEEQYSNISFRLAANAGVELAVQVMRDQSGNNSGGVEGFTPTVEAGLEWGDVPSASITISRWINTP